MGLETFLPCTTLFMVFRDMKNSNPTSLQNIGLNYIKLFALKSLSLFLLLSCAQAQENEIQPAQEKKQLILGIENFLDDLESLGNKRIGIVGNQSSLVQSTHLVDTLIARGVEVVKVFSPEHGFRGNADAGEHVATEKDEKTGLPIYSLYGKQKKPSKESLAGIDILIFDIQDVGVRFYTYISTLHYVMEACAENNIPLIVLDRPNPNGHYVDGPVLDTNYRSFVGMHRVPIVHGMTIGEYGKMINGEQWLPNGLQCDLRVYEMSNYTHDTPYSLPVPPSPNLRSDLSIQLYPSLCLLEATTVTVGRGTEHPFECYGHPKFPASETSYNFTPTPGYGSKDPKHKGVKCNGFLLNDSSYFHLEKLDLSFLMNANKLLGGKLFVDQEKFFNLLAGNNILLKQITSGLSEDEIRKSWSRELDNYKNTIRPRYMIYP